MFHIISPTSGGEGGNGGGTFARISGKGGAGSAGSGFGRNARIAYGGLGGENAAGSSPQYQQSIVGPNTSSIVFNGTQGLSFGAGGNGGQFAAGIEESPSPQGGDGASACILLTEYRFSELTLNSRILRVDSFGSSIGNQTYTAPPGALLLHVFIWGGGGGGGGCTNNPVAWRTGGGGGGGGSAEAIFLDPLPSYPYYIATGAPGGTGLKCGGTAEMSWFSNPADVSAFGGRGGASLESAESLLAWTIPGGMGGIALGRHCICNMSGEQGEDGLIDSVDVGGPNNGFFTGGRGGAGGTKSGSSATPQRVGPGTNAGINGNPYGGGGSGACVIGVNSEGANGGNGADGHLVVIAFG